MSSKLSSGSNPDQSVRILVDGHGGDGAPGIVIDALTQTLKKHGSTHRFGIVGIPDLLIPALESAAIADQVELVEASEFIDMCEAPAVALRRKKNSSIHVGARAVRDGQWDALVSAGNTGALMAVSKLILKTIPGIDRPAIASMIPTVDGGSTLFLDVGANVDCTSEHLFQFAIMGSCYLQAAYGIGSPRIGLLNIGSEEIKGTDVVKVAASKLQESDLNFIGNVEGTDLFSNEVDVVVCDGFVGNVSLKTMEGVAKMIIQKLKSELTSSVVAKTGAVLASGALRRLKNAMNPSEYNGAPLLGLNGIVVKSHGSADAYGYACAIDVAINEVQENLIDTIVNTMNSASES